MCFGGNAWTDHGWLEEAECGGSKGNNLAPQVHRKRRINAGKTFYEVIFEGVDRVLGFVGTVQVGRDQLESNIVGEKMSF